MMKFQSHAALAVLALVAPLSVAHAEEAGGTFSALVENDFFGSEHTDRHYTQGLRLVWSPAKSEVYPWGGDTGVAAFLARQVPWLVPEDAKAKVRVAYSVGQSIFTPSDLRQTIPDPKDRPYAGWLYGGVTLVSEVNRDQQERLSQLDTLGLDVGIVGPSALAKQTQQAFHRFLGGNQIIPKGWDHQLHDEPGVLISYDKKWRFVVPIFSRDAKDFSLDATPSLGANVGNVYTGASTGITLRFGQSLPDDYGPPRIRPGLAGSDFVERPPADRNFFGWYLFGGVEGRAVLRNIFLDGNSFRSSPHVEKNNFVADFQAGMAVLVGGVRITYTHVWRTREFQGQRGNDVFGAIGLSANF
jgi:lipid A 3-O-deacylase